MAKLPSVSIITPSLNSARTIAQCIRSVSEQGQRVEHIVVDGHSSDGTQRVVQRTKPDVTFIERSPAGIYDAINKGIREATGGVIGILHSDDFFASSHVLENVLLVFEHPGNRACYGDLCYVDSSDSERVIRYWRSGGFERQRFLNGWMPPHPSFFVRKEIYEQFGLYRTDLGTAADYEFMLRVLYKYRIKAVHIPSVLVHMRAGGQSNSSWRARIEANRMDRKAWEVNGLRPYPWTTIAKPLRKIGQWWARP